MRNCFASALTFAGVLATGSVACADTITQRITFSTIHTLTVADRGINPTSIAIQPFNPALGTLTSVSEVLSGTAVLNTLNGGPGTGTNIFVLSLGIMTIFADDPNAPYPVAIADDYTSTPTTPGPFPIVGSGDDALAELLATVSGSGPVDAFLATNLQFPNPAGVGESLSFPDGISAAIDYNYTASSVTPVPEPPGLVLTGIGAVAALTLLRRPLWRRC